MKKYLLILLLIFSITYSQLDCNFFYYVAIPNDALDEIRNPRIRYAPIDILVEEQIPIYTLTPTSTNIIEIGGVKYTVYLFEGKYSYERCGAVSVVVDIDIADKSCTLGGRVIPSSFAKFYKLINVSYGTIITKPGKISLDDCYLPSSYFDVYGIDLLQYGSIYEITDMTLEKGRTYIIDVIYSSLKNVRLYAKEYKMLCAISSDYIYYYSKFDENPARIDEKEMLSRYSELFPLRNEIFALSEKELKEYGYTVCKIYSEKDVKLDLYSKICYGDLCRAYFKYTPSTDDTTFVVFYADITVDYAFLKTITITVNLGGYPLLTYSNDMHIAFPKINASEPDYITFISKDEIKDKFFYYPISPIFKSPIFFPSYRINSTIIFKNTTHTLNIPTTFVLTPIYELTTSFYYIPTNLNYLKSLIVENEPFNIKYVGITYDAGATIFDRKVFRSNNFIYSDVYMLKPINLLFTDKVSKAKIVDKNVEIEISFKLFRNDTLEEFKNANCYIEYIYSGIFEANLRKIGPFFEYEMPIYYNDERGSYYNRVVKNITELGINENDRIVNFEVVCKLIIDPTMSYAVGREIFYSYYLRPFTIFGYELSTTEGLRMFFSIFLTFLIPAIVGYFVRNVYFSTVALILTASYFFFAGFINTQMYLVIVIIGVITLLITRHFILR